MCSKTPEHRISPPTVGSRLLLTSVSPESPWRWHDARCPPRGSWRPHRPSRLPLRDSARSRAPLRSPSGFACMMEFPLLCILSATCWMSPVCRIQSKREDGHIQFRKMSPVTQAYILHGGVSLSIQLCSFPEFCEVIAKKIT